MANEKHCSTTTTHFLHFSEAFFLKLGIADSQHFIDNKNFRFKMGSYRKCEPNIHSARITFDRCVEKLFGLGKSDDFIEFRCDLSAAHAKNRAVQKNVLAPGELRMKPRPDLQ